MDVELLSEWADSAWKHTQQRTFRTLRAQQEHTAIITNCETDVHTLYAFRSVGPSVQ